MELKQYIGRELNAGAWFLISQERISAFAECTEDRNFIHVDPARAELSPFKGTIAHGFLTLSMLASMCLPSVSELRQGRISVNYGFEKVRFLNPVHAGKRIRAHVRVLEIRDKEAGSSVVRLGVSVEIENESRPALVADWLVMWLPEDAPGTERAPLQN